MLISVPTNAQISKDKLILKYLRKVSMFLHHPQEDYKLCQLRLRVIELSNTIKQYVVMVNYRVRHISVNTNGFSYAPGSQYIVVGGKAARNA
jgi:hypothetical protein